MSETMQPIAHQAEDRGVDLFYAPSESIFAAVAYEMVALGWSVFPQSSEGRYPGRVYGDAIRWGAEHDLRNRLPTGEALRLWAAHCGTLNVACVFGPASGNTIALDVDVDDDATARAIVGIAHCILGYTPLARQGRAPKIALIYRHAPDDVVPSTARRIAGDDGHAIEIQGAGKLLTFHGKHHRTGRYFKWLNDSPLAVGPQAAPLVTSARVSEFLAAVDAKFPFVQGAPACGVFSSSAPSSAGLRKPVATVSGGIVTEGRHAHMRSTVFLAVRGNADKLLAAREAGTAEVDAVSAAVPEIALTAFSETAALTGKWSAEFTKRTIRAEVAHTARRLLNGEIPTRRPRVTLAKAYSRPKLGSPPATIGTVPRA